MAVCRASRGGHSHDDVGHDCRGPFTPAWRVQPVLRHQLKQAPPASEQLLWRSFLAFYIPLVMTSLLQIINPAHYERRSDPDARPCRVAGGLSVLFGLVSFWTSVSIGYIEVVVVLLDQPRSARSLRRFALLLGGLTQRGIGPWLPSPPCRTSGLSTSPPCLHRCWGWLMQACGLFYRYPLLSGLAELVSGAVAAQPSRPRGITEAVIFYIGVSILALWLGTVWGQTTGLFIGLLTFVIASLARTGWLWFRARPVLQARARQEINVRKNLTQTCLLLSLTWRR